MGFERSGDAIDPPAALDLLGLHVEPELLLERTGNGAADGVFLPLEFAGDLVDRSALIALKLSINFACLLLRGCGARLFVFALTAPLNVAPVYGQGFSPNGVWLHPNKRIQVEIAPCGAMLCGKMVWFRRPNDAEGPAPCRFKKFRSGSTRASPVRPHGGPCFSPNR